MQDTEITLYDRNKLSILFTDGMAAVTSNGINHLNRGDVVLFRPDEMHFARILREGVHEYLTILIPTALLSDFGAEDFVYLFEDSAPDRVNHLSPSPEIRVEILRLAERIATQLQNLDETVSLPLRMVGCVIYLLELCLSLYDTQKHHPLVSAIPAVISTALEYIHTRYADITGLEDIAAQAGCSVTYLTRLFRKYTGITVHGYLTSCRLSHAKFFLDSGMSVTDTCYRTGFGDCSGFIKTFHAAEGITPLQYKKRREINNIHVHNSDISVFDKATIQKDKTTIQKKNTK